jgi:hypothetical protein
MTEYRNFHSQYPNTSMTEASSVEFEPLFRPHSPPPKKKTPQNPSLHTKAKTIDVSTVVTFYGNCLLFQLK